MLSFFKRKNDKMKKRLCQIMEEVLIIFSIVKWSSNFNSIIKHKKTNKKFWVRKKLSLSHKFSNPYIFAI